MFGGADLGIPKLAEVTIEQISCRLAEAERQRGERAPAPSKSLCRWCSPRHRRRRPPVHQLRTLGRPALLEDDQTAVVAVGAPQIEIGRRTVLGVLNHPP